MKLKLSLINIIAGIFLFLTSLLLYHNLGRDYLYDWDESIYAQLGVEQNLTHPLTPTWNGALWLEKPPLIAYVTALGEHLTTDPELGARLLIPVFTLLTLVSVYILGSHFGGSVGGALAIFILMYFDLFIGRSRSVNTDIMLLSGITLTSALLVRNAQPVFVALALSLALFAKGPAGLLALFIALPLFLSKPKRYVLHTAGFFLLITFPWHLYQFLTHGAEFYTPYLLEQVVRRATVPIEFHLESRWFYFQHLYRDLGVGVLLLSALGLALTLKQKQFFLIWWTLLPLVIFTAAKTRLSWYILPLYPALALAIGVLFAVISKPLIKKHLPLILLLTVAIASQSLLHLYRTTEADRPTTSYPDHIKLASLLSTLPGSSLAYLVSASERTAEAILPQTQRLSSSFRYGGAPSVVFYSQKQVDYYYNYDHFTAALSQGKHPLAVVDVGDVDKIPPGYQLLSKQGNYYAYQKVEAYAQR